MRSALVAALLIGCDEGPAPITHFDDSVSIHGDLAVDHGVLRLTTDSSPSLAPEIHWNGMNGAWVTGIDVANNGGSRDFVLAAKHHWPYENFVNDLIYVAHNDERAPTVGIGVTPPHSGFRLEVSGQDDEPEMGTLLLRRSPDQKGNVLAVRDSSGRTNWAIDADYWVTGQHGGTDAAVAVRANILGRTLAVGRADGSAVYGFQYAADESGALAFRYLTGAINNVEFQTSGEPHFPNGLTTRAIRIDSRTAPASANEACRRGDLRYDQDFIYVCVADDQWRRAGLSTW